MLNTQSQAALASDVELLAGIAARSTDSLHELFDRYSAAAYSLALRMLGEPQRAEACVQTVFLRLWREPRVNEHAGDIVEWLLKAVHQQAGSARASWARQRYPAAAVPATPAARAGVLQQPGRVGALLQLAEKQAAARTALASLPEPERSALQLAYFDGMPQAAIAAALGESQPTVQTLTRSGMAHLRAALTMPALAHAQTEPRPAASLTLTIEDQATQAALSQQPLDRLAAALVGLRAAQQSAADLRFRAEAVQRGAGRTLHHAAAAQQRADESLQQLRVLRELYEYLGDELNQADQPDSPSFVYTEAYFAQHRQNIDVSQVIAVLTLLNAHSDREAYERLPALLR